MLCLARSGWGALISDRKGWKTFLGEFLFCNELAVGAADGSEYDVYSFV